LSVDLIVTVLVDDSSELSVPAVVTIPAGSDFATFLVRGVNDGRIDGTQTATVSVSASGLTNSYASLSVTDINTAKVGITALRHATEVVSAVSVGIFNLQLSAIAGMDLEVPYTISGTAVSGTDFVALSGSATILSGQSSVTISINAIDDDFAEYSETLRLTLGIPTVAGLTANPTANSAQILILDNDVAGIAVSNRAVTVSETGTMASICVKLTSMPEVPVRLLIGMSDLTEATAFGPGNSTFLTFTSSNWNVEQTVTITGVDDTLTDGSLRSTVSLSVDLTLSPPPLYRSVTPVVIDVTTLDNEPAAPLSTVDSVVTFNRDAAAERSLSPQKNGQRSIIRQIEVVLDGDVAVSTGAVSNGGFVMTKTGANPNIGLTVTSRVFTGGKTRIVLMFTSGIEVSGSLVSIPVRK